MHVRWGGTGFAHCALSPPGIWRCVSVCECMCISSVFEFMLHSKCLRSLLAYTFGTESFRIYSFDWICHAVMPDLYAVMSSNPTSTSCSNQYRFTSWTIPPSWTSHGGNYDNKQRTKLVANCFKLLFVGDVGHRACIQVCLETQSKPDGILTIQFEWSSLVGLACRVSESMLVTRVSLRQLYIRNGEEYSNPVAVQKRQRTCTYIWLKMYAGMHLFFPRSFDGLKLTKLTLTIIIIAARHIPRLVHRHDFFISWLWPTHFNRCESPNLGFPRIYDVFSN